MTTEHTTREPRRYWTMHERRQLGELLEAGLAASEIGQHLGGRTRKAIWDSMRRFGMRFPPDSPHFYTRPSDGRRVRGGGGPRWTAEDRAKLAELARQRLSAAEIAKHMPGRSPLAVAHQRRQMQLSHYAPGPSWRYARPGRAGEAPPEEVDMQFRR